MRMEILERDGMAIPQREITTASCVKRRPARGRVAWGPSARRRRVQQRRQPESGRPPPPKQVLKLCFGRPRQPLARVLELVQKLPYGHVDVVTNHSAPAAGLEPPLTIRHAYLKAFIAARELHARISRPRLPVELFPRFGHRRSF